MLNLEKMWKTIKRSKNYNRVLKEVNYCDVNLKEYILIDVRSRREYKETHLNNSINIPLYEIKKDIIKLIKNKNKKLLLVCQSGIRSAKAVKILEDLGYKEVYNLKGGLENI